MLHTHCKVAQTTLVAIASSVVFLFVLFLPLSTHAAINPGDEGNFITTWDTTQPGVTDEFSIRIPGTGTNYHIYWENTASSTMNGTTTATNAVDLTFPEPGIYRVEITGDFTQIRFANGGDKDKILTVEQWGDIEWTSMDRAFQGCSNLRVPATDAPDLSGVTSLNLTFSFAEQFNQPISNWNVSNVTNMSYTFWGAKSFNQPLNSWDVSSVTGMRNMFHTTAFNQPLDAWDVSNVTTMHQMFRSSPFNQDIGGWDVSSVQSMRSMFFNNRDFNQDISNWDISNLPYMPQMFWGATAFNQDLSSWDTSNVTTMRGMFNGATAFNQDLSAWDISSITPDEVDIVSHGMESMFQNTSLSTTNLDNTLASWAQQAVDNDLRDIPLHIGLKTYSDIGAEAIATLKGLGWTITEQYKAEYSGGQNATLIGTGTQRPLDSGATTTEVEIIPDDDCDFIAWSDGNESNPRHDVLTDNLSVTANVSCTPTRRSSAASQAAALDTQGRTDEAQALRERYNIPTATPRTFEETMEEVRTLAEQPLPPLDPVRDRDAITELIKLLTELIQTLMQLLLLSTDTGETAN